METKTSVDDDVEDLGNLGDPVIVDGLQRCTCKELVIVKYTEESWNPNLREVGEWGDLNIGG